MKRSGPILELLTHRLADTPPEFLAEPLIDGIGEVHVAALVNDLLGLHGARADAAALAPFLGNMASAGNVAKAARNRLALTMIAVWLLAHESFIDAHCQQEGLLGVLNGALTGTLAELVRSTPAHAFVHDPERREELARVVLAELDMRPAGETLEQATDRLAAISGAERLKLLAATRAAAQRAREVREALTRKAAEEAADKWTRD